MERSSKRGKIPQQDWPSIIKRYEAGETLAAIARTYDCSPPAISYILSRSRGRDLAGEAVERSANGPVDPEPELSKTVAASEGPPEPDLAEMPGREPPQLAATGTPHPVAAGSADTIEIPVLEAKAPVPSSHPQSGEPRRTLHLSLAQNNTPDALQHGPPVSDAGRRGAVPSALGNAGEPHPAKDNGTRDGGGKDVGAFIDRALRERVDGDISAFLAAFDAALAQDTIENRAGLREATDRLLRAGARTRIELERLEARLPLTARAQAGYAVPSWRPR